MDGGRISMSDFESRIEKAIDKYELYGCSFTNGQAVRELVRHGYEMPTGYTARLAEALEQDYNTRAMVEMVDISLLDELAIDFIEEEGGNE